MNIVITTIFPPTKGAHALSAGLQKRSGTMWVLGDRKGPDSYDLPAVEFVSIDAQIKLPFQLVPLLPEKHYTRKNLGYLLAMKSQPDCIVETDDDNIPTDKFWYERTPTVEAQASNHVGWFNVYRLFSKENIWPRGFPLERIASAFPRRDGLSAPGATECLIQQGLADENPDVDAIYRMTLPLPMNFDEGGSVSLGRNCWCPFNSQNTTFFKEAFPLLYLPSFCSFRMTDIWRSFVAQRCLWEMDSSLLFHQSTVYQERNEHDLLRDFADEVPGYLNNDKIRQVLESLSMESGRAPTVVCRNVENAYRALVAAEIFPEKELALVQAWNADVCSLLC